MAYDDGYYYGQCKIVAVVDNTADNGKTVQILTDDGKTYSGTIANKKCEFLLPPRTLYTVQKVSSGTAEFETKVEAGYGECIQVHLDTGYVEVKQGDIVGLDYIKAASATDLAYKVPEANAVKTLNNNLTTIDNNLSDLSKNNLGSSVDLRSYNTSSKLYTCPCDGYVQATIGSMSYSSVVQVYFYGATTGNYGSIILSGNGSSIYQRQLVMVRKGMRILIACNPNSEYVVFFPFE